MEPNAEAARVEGETEGTPDFGILYDTVGIIKRKRNGVTQTIVGLHHPTGVLNKNN